MIIDPREIQILGREMSTASDDVFGKKLVELHKSHKLNTTSIVLIPEFWCETVLYGVQEMVKEIPSIKLGSILEFKNRLRLYTIPAYAVVEELKVKLYNKIDTLTLDAVETLMRGTKKPFFMQ
jgi:hypothetical protein